MNNRVEPIRGDTSGAQARPRARDLWEQGRRVERDLEDLRDAIRQTVTTGQNLVRSRLRDQPYATLLAAAGVGYVLGGGLPRIPVRLLLGLGGRLAYGALMTQLLHALADNSGRHFADR